MCCIHNFLNRVKSTYQGSLAGSKLVVKWMFWTLIKANTARFLGDNWTFYCDIGDNIQGILSGGFGLFLPSLLVVLSAGIFEEFLVRGLFFSGILNLFQNNRFKLILTSLISSAIFGLLHLVNIIHSPVQAVLQQVFYVTVIGLVFAIIRITANSLWLPVLIHALIDFQPTITFETVDVNPWLTLIIIYLPLALFSIITLSSLDKNLNHQETNL